SRRSRQVRVGGALGDLAVPERVGGLVGAAGGVLPAGAELVAGERAGGLAHEGVPVVAEAPHGGLAVGGRDAVEELGVGALADLVVVADPVEHAAPEGHRGGGDGGEDAAGAGDGEVL